MSIEAVSWALSTQRVATPMQRLVLIAVANHADKRGQSAWPSQETLAEYCCCSSRTIRRQLSELEESGIIRRGDQRLVSHFRGGYRPVVYDVDLGGDEPADNSGGGRTSATDLRPDNLSRLDTGVHRGRTSATLRPDTGVLRTVLEPSIEPSIESNPFPSSASGEEQADSLDAGFKEFMEAYPIKDWLPRAQRSYKSALKFITHEELLERVAEQRDYIVEYRYKAYLWLRHGKYMKSASEIRDINADGKQCCAATDGKVLMEQSSKRQLDAEFEKFWALVGRKRGKQQARKSFEKQRRTHSMEFICSQLMKAQAEWMRTGREPEYWPHPSTWLNQQLDDDYDTTSVPSQREFYEARVQMIREQHLREKAQLTAVADDVSMPAITSTCIEEDDEDDDGDDWDWGA